MQTIDSYHIVSPSQKTGEKQKYFIGKALDCINHELAITPDDYDCLCRRASYKIKLGLFQDAIEDCETALTLNLVYAEAYNMRGIAKANINDHKGAIRDFDMALSMSGDYAEAYYNKGYISMEIQDYETAIDYFTKTIQIAEFAPAFLFRGVAKNILDMGSGDEDEKRAEELFGE
jgi:tetratricopeptide (TPR) repeat protein